MFWVSHLNPVSMRRFCWYHNIRNKKICFWVRTVIWGAVSHGRKKNTSVLFSNGMPSYAGGRHSDLIHETANELDVSIFDVVDGYSSRRNKCNNLDPKSQFVIIIGSVVHMPDPSGPVSIYILYKRATTDRPAKQHLNGVSLAGDCVLVSYHWYK